MASIKTVRQSIVDQLIEHGEDIEVSRGLIDDYLFYFAEEKKMQKDVRKNGYMIDAVSSTGKLYKRENPAVKMAMLYNKQKLAILKQLGLSPSAIITADDSEGGDDL